MGAYVTINPTPSGDITGSGTAGYLAMFTSANVIGDSTINQASGNTGVGMAASASIGFGITTTAATSGTKTGFYFLQTGNTGQAASTEANGVFWSMGARQWDTGAITDQREFYIGSCAYSFVAASTITNAYGLYVEAPTAGTNATITNNYAAGFSGAIRVIGALGSNASIMVDNSTGGYGALWSDGTQGLIFRITSGDVVQFGDINAKNKGIGFVTNGSTRVSIGASGGMTFSDSNNITFNATTGTKIGTATTEKLSFWNATPIVQPTTGITGAARVGGGGAAVTDTDTFGGYTIAQLAAVIINTGLAA